MLFSSLTVLTACGGGGESGGEQGGGESGGGSGEGGNGNGGGSGEGGSGNGGGSGEGGSGDKPETARYEVSVKLANGKPLGNVGIFVYNNVEDLNNELPRTYRSLDAQGFVSLDLPKSEDYVISLVITEEGYNCAPYYELEAETSIILTTSVISNPDLSGVRYGTGDVMRDFTVTDTDGNVFTLSEVLKEKRGVLINFWFVNCGPCASEFPPMNTAYGNYSDDIEIIALAPSSQSGNTSNEAIRKYKEDMGLDFRFAYYDSTALVNAFSVSAYPTSVFVDRYGVICLIEEGAVISEKPFNAAFAHFSSDKYEQQLFESIGDLIPVELPDKVMPPSADIEAAINGENFATDAEGDKINATFKPEMQPGSAEYSWPFIVGEKDGKTCIYASNSRKDSSFAMIYSYVTLKAGEALAIDYFASTEYSEDRLVVIVNGKDVLQISGDSSDEGWRTCYPYVATEDGEYEVVFAYIKSDGTDFGEDTVYLTDYRIVKSDAVDSKTYIPRFAATNLVNGLYYSDFVEIVYNETDGYYHVGSETGPILLANLMGRTRFSDTPVVNIIGSSDAPTNISVNGVSIYGTVIKYCNYATNASLGLTGYCPVTEELRKCLVAIAAEIGEGVLDGITPEQEWLEMCEYYDAYGTGGKQLEDPIKGLAPFSAYEAIVNEAGDKTTYPNKFVYDRIIMPRGLKAKFVPSESGVYLITSQSNHEVDAWIFLEDNSQYVIYSNNDRFATDYNNCYMIAYFEAGKAYYIDIAFYEVTQFGTINFGITKIGEAGYGTDTEYYRFGKASDTAHTYDLDDVTCINCGEKLTNVKNGYGTCLKCGKDNVKGNPTFELIDGGIDVKYDSVTDRYYEVWTGGELGGMLYADFTNPTFVFGDATLLQILDRGGFNFAVDAEGNPILDSNGNAASGLVDYTDRVRAIIDELMIDEGEEGKIDGVTDGCVPVTRELAEILQMLLNKYSFKIKTPGEDFELGSWKKVCYRYEYFGPENIPTPKDFEE